LKTAAEDEDRFPSSGHASNLTLGEWVFPSSAIVDAAAAAASSSSSSSFSDAKKNFIYFALCTILCTIVHVIIQYHNIAKRLARSRQQCLF